MKVTQIRSKPLTYGELSPGDVFAWRHEYDTLCLRTREGHVALRDCVHCDCDAALCHASVVRYPNAELRVER